MLLFCVKSIVKESHKFELARLKKAKKKKKKERKTFWPAGNFLVWYFCDAFSTTECVVRKVTKFYRKEKCRITHGWLF